jgi:dipeptidyl aminopeptidase/acylaminoacyl peptidase
MLKFLTVLILAEPAEAANELIPRSQLFGHAARASALMSPDGLKVAWIESDDKNVGQIFVQTFGKTDTRPVTADAKRGIQYFQWSGDSEGLLFLQDAEGDEKFHVFLALLKNGHVRDLTPFKGVKADLVAVDEAHPQEILVSMNLRKPDAFDVHRIFLKTGAVHLDTENSGHVFRWQVDSAFQVRGAIVQNGDGSTELVVRPEGTNTPKITDWKSVAHLPLEDNVFVENLGILGFSPDGNRVFLKSPHGSDTLRVVEKNVQLGHEKIVAQNATSDANDVLFHRRFGVQAVAFLEGGRKKWAALDTRVKKDFAVLSQSLTGDFSIESRNQHDTRWLLSVESGNSPRKYFLYTRATQALELLFSTRPELEKLPLATPTPVTIQARDGLNLPSFLTLPEGAQPDKLPLVLLVHGGPWGQDDFRFRPDVQLLANRGYAVLQVNFRASSGFGQKFLNAGNQQWGLAMQNDLLDAVAWAVAKGIDPKRVAVMGASYGGYAALAAGTFSPDTFRAVVDQCGISNLLTFLRSFPPQWEVMRSMWTKRLGDPVADEVRLKATSPFFHASRMKAPLLIGQGANDPRVKRAESEQMVSAMRQAGKRVTYALYEDEGHGFARPENKIDFMARVERFLADELGGRYEPLPSAGKMAGSSAIVTESSPKP